MTVRVLSTTQAAPHTRSSLHVDQWQGHFWMAMVKGTKRWSLFHRDDIPYLSPDYTRGTLDPSFPHMHVMDRAHAAAKDGTANTTAAPASASESSESPESSESSESASSPNASSSSPPHTSARLLHTGCACVTRTSVPGRRAGNATPSRGGDPTRACVSRKGTPRPSRRRSRTRSRRSCATSSATSRSRRSTVWRTGPCTRRARSRRQPARAARPVGQRAYALRTRRRHNDVPQRPRRRVSDRV